MALASRERLAPRPARPPRVFAASAAREVQAATAEVTLMVIEAVAGSDAPNAPLRSAASAVPGNADGDTCTETGIDLDSPAMRSCVGGNPVTDNPALVFADSVTWVEAFPSESSVSVVLTVEPGVTVAPSGNSRIRSALAAGVVNAPLPT